MSIRLLSQRLFAIALLLVCVALTKSTIAASTYTIQALGPPDGSVMTFAATINDSGVIAGYLGNGRDDGGYHAVLFDGSSAIDLGAGPASQAVAINESGTVVGWSIKEGNNVGFIYEHGIAMPISFGGRRSVEYSINDRGQVVGYASISDGEPPKATLYQDGVLNDLTPTLGPDKYPYAINNRGAMVGDAVDRDSSINTAFLYDGSSVINLHPMVGFGKQSVAYGINNRGDIIGVYLADNGSRHAFLLSRGKSVALGGFSDAPTAETLPLSINNQGVVIGDSTMPNGDLHPFIYDGGGLKDLTTLVDYRSAGWTNLYQATGINNRGQIIGFGSLNGHAQAFVLTPISGGGTAGG